MSLLESTHNRLRKARAAGITIPDIARSSEGRVNYEWLKKFAAGKIPKPGVQVVEDLHDTLGEMLPGEKRRRA